MNERTNKKERARARENVALCRPTHEIERTNDEREGAATYLRARGKKSARTRRRAETAGHDAARVHHRVSDSYFLGS